MKILKGVAAAMLVLGAAACSDNGSSGGSSSGGGSSVGNLSSCQQAYSPEKVAAGGDCTPLADAYCPNTGSSGSLLNPEVRPCDGVEISDVSITVSGMRSHYLAIRPAGQASFNTVVLGLHYLVGNVVAFANVARLTELAKARGVLVLVPQAPGPGGTNLTSVWPVTSLNASLLPSYLQFLSGVVADGRARFGAASAKLYVAGLSNGAAMAYLYGCLSTDPVLGVLAVAGDLGNNVVDECQPTRPLGTVIVHGTADALAPYNGLGASPLVIRPSVPSLHAKFKANNNCSGSDAVANMPLYFDDKLVTISYTGACSQNRRDFLVSVNGGGHVWPGGSESLSALESLQLFGFTTGNFDATIQGFDLLRLAGGG